jgi:hypothetical protein
MGTKLPQWCISATINAVNASKASTNLQTQKLTWYRSKSKQTHFMLLTNGKCPLKFNGDNFFCIFIPHPLLPFLYPFCTSISFLLLSHIPFPFLSNQNNNEKISSALCYFNIFVTRIKSTSKSCRSSTCKIGHSSI